VGKQKNNNKIYLDSRFYYCLVIAVFVLFTLFYALSQRNVSVFDTSSKKFSHNWYYDDQTKVDFDDLSKESTYKISKTIEKGSLNNKSLCFYSKNVYFTVFINGKSIYDFHPTPKRLLGRSYAVYPHAIAIPVLYDDQCVISIRIDNLYEETPGFISDLTVEDGNYFIIREMQKNAPNFLLCTVVFVLGTVAFIIGIAGKYFGDRRYEIISMGTFAMVSSLWIATETSFLATLLGSPIAIHFVDYMMLAILPLPTVLFASFVTGNKNSAIAMAVALLSALNLLMQILLTCLKISDYHRLLWISHVILCLTVIAVLFLFVKSIIKKTLPKALLIILTITFLVPLMVGVWEMIRYRIDPGAYHGTPAYQYILFLFIFLCCIYEFFSISEMSRKGQYAEIMEKLAYTDALTNLFNREAYNRFIEEEIEKGEHYTFIMLDMNHLKEVNDNFGHEKGDEYIKTLANSIKNAFGDIGNCYRMGGDEFLVITPVLSVDIKFMDSLDALYSGINTYNETNSLDIPLSVALGYSDYSVKNGSIKEALKEADTKMYERKNKMKEEMKINIK